MLPDSNSFPPHDYKLADRFANIKPMYIYIIISVSYDRFTWFKIKEIFSILRKLDMIFPEVEGNLIQRRSAVKMPVFQKAYPFMVFFQAQTM